MNPAPPVTRIVFIKVIFGRMTGTLPRTVLSFYLRPFLLRRRPRARSIPPLDVIDHKLLEIGRDGRAAQGHGLLAVDEHRRGGLFAGAWQRNADVGVLALARAVHDAAH